MRQTFDPSSYTEPAPITTLPHSHSFEIRHSCRAFRSLLSLETVHYVVSRSPLEQEPTKDSSPYNYLGTGSCFWFTSNGLDGDRLIGKVGLITRAGIFSGSHSSPQDSPSLLISMVPPLRSCAQCFYPFHGSKLL